MSYVTMCPGTHFTQLDMYLVYDAYMLYAKML